MPTNWSRTPIRGACVNSSLTRWTLNHGGRLRLARDRLSLEGYVGKMAARALIELTRSVRQSEQVPEPIEHLPEVFDS